MIQQSEMKVERVRWQKILAEGVSSVSELLTLLDLNPKQFEVSSDVTRQFALRVPRSFIARMRKGDENDPLLRQVLPLNQELNIHADYSNDPLQELSSNPIPGLLHKYKNRVLLTLTGACAINCRYCFRRHFPYSENTLQKDNWSDILNYIAQNSAIDEVILSGGEPLLLSDLQLKSRIEDLAAISHVRYLRIHTRLPIVLPERINDDLISNLLTTRLKVVMVIHCNHANEIDDNVADAAKSLQKAGIIMLNQAVLLKGVNDSADALQELSHALFRLGILPYYLHYPDKVQGTQHFTVDLVTAKQIMREISASLPGYLVPKFVIEEGGERHKLLVPFV